MTKNVEKMLSSMRKETKELKPLDLDKRLAEMEKEMKNLKPLDLDKRLAEMEKEMKVANKKLTKLKKTDDTIIRFFDNEVIETKKRVNRIEDHLHLPSLRAL